MINKSSWNEYVRSGKRKPQPGATAPAQMVDRSIDKWTERERERERETHTEREREREAC